MLKNVFDLHVTSRSRWNLWVKLYPNVKFSALSESEVKKTISLELTKLTFNWPWSWHVGVIGTTDSWSARPKTYRLLSLVGGLFRFHFVVLCNLPQRSLVIRWIRPYVVCRALRWEVLGWRPLRLAYESLVKLLTLKFLVHLVKRRMFRNANLRTKNHRVYFMRVIR